MGRFDPFGTQRIERALAGMRKALDQLDARTMKMSEALDKMTAAVTKLDSVEASILALVKAMAQQIKDLVAAGAEGPAFSALADDINAKADEIAAAVTENTPSA